MAEFILKDWYGKDCRFNHDTIFVQDVNGELVQFTQGKGESVLESLEVTENGTYTPNEGVDGFDSVTVDVPIPEVVLQDKTITENGTFTADEGFGGLGSVTVDVKGSGGGSLPAGVYLSKSPINSPNNYRQKRFMYKGELYVASAKSTSDGSVCYIYKWNGSSWTTILSDTTSTNGISNAAVDADDFQTVEYNGKLHIFSSAKHAIFDGTTLISSTAIPSGVAYPVVYKGELWVGNDSKCLYKWDDSSATWETVVKFSSYRDYAFVVNDELYFYDSKKLYKYDYDSKTTSEVGVASAPITYRIVIGDKLYYIALSSLYGTVYKYDFETGTETKLGDIPNFSKVGLTQGANDISFVAYENSATSRYPFFVATIIEE